MTYSPKSDIFLETRKINLLKCGNRYRFNRKYGYGFISIESIELHYNKKSIWIEYANANRFTQEKAELHSPMYVVQFSFSICHLLQYMNTFYNDPDYR